MRLVSIFYRHALVLSNTIRKLNKDSLNNVSRETLFKRRVERMADIF